MQTPVPHTVCFGITFNFLRSIATRFEKHDHTLIQRNGPYYNVAQLAVGVVVGVSASVDVGVSVGVGISVGVRANLLPRVGALNATKE